MSAAVRQFSLAAVLAATLVFLPEAFATAATYEPGDGAVPFYTFEDEQLNDRMQISVNVASGNLLVTASDMYVRGTGLDLEVTRYHNSLDTAQSDLGFGWTLSVGQDVRLAPQADGSVDVFPPSGFKAKYQPAAGGAFTAPTGFHARLERKTDAFELTYNQSRAKYRFPLAGGPASSLTDKNGNRISFTYDGTGKLTSIKDSQDRTHTAGYTSGKLTSVTDSSGRVVRYEQDGGELETFTDGSGRFTTYLYDAAHRLVRIDDPQLDATKISYDASGRVTQYMRTNAADTPGPTTRFAYATGDSRCPAGTTSTRVTDPNNNATVYCWDSERRIKKVIDAHGHERDTSYDTDSNVTELASGSSISKATWLEGGRLESVTSPTGAKSSFSYSDPAHEFFPTSFKNAEGNTTGYGWQTNNLTTVTDGDGKQTKLTYNSNGTVASSTTPKGAGQPDPNPYKTTYEYDAKGNLTKINHPAPLGAETFTYDSLSRLKTRTTGKGQTETYSYDALDRVISIGFADGSLVAYQYDHNGNRIARIGPEGDRGYLYDDFNRLISESIRNGPFAQYTYDAAGNLTSITDSGGQVLYAYDVVNNITQVTEPGGTKTTFAYDARDNRTQTAYPNGVTIAQQFDGSDRPTEILARKGTAAPLVHLTYGYDPDGVGPLVDSSLRQTEQDKVANTTTSYAYDALDRLRDAHTVTTGTSTTRDRFTYAYDANSNRTSQTHNGQQTTYSYNPANELQQTGSTTYTYDANGNLLSSSAGLALTYNAKDQTATVKPPGAPSALTLAYGGADQFERVREGATTFENNALGLGVKIDGTTRAYFTRDDDRRLVSQRLPNDARHYYLFDALGSVVALTDKTGAVSRRYSYDPFGNTLSTSGTVDNPFRFAGEYAGAGPLYKIGMRYYDPNTGRWTQQDARNTPTDPREANRYLYVGADPVNSIDPFGLHACPATIESNIANCEQSVDQSAAIGRLSRFASGCAGLGGAAFGATGGLPGVSEAAAAGGCVAGGLISLETGYTRYRNDLPSN